MKAEKYQFSEAKFVKIKLCGKGFLCWWALTCFNPREVAFYLNIFHKKADCHKDSCLCALLGNIHILKGF